MLYAPDVTDDEIAEALDYCQQHVSQIRAGAILHDDASLNLLGAYVAARNTDACRSTRAWLALKLRQYRGS
jgi:hypothetical protein